MRTFKRYPPKYEEYGEEEDGSSDVSLVVGGAGTAGGAGGALSAPDGGNQVRLVERDYLDAARDQDSQRREQEGDYHQGKEGQVVSRQVSGGSVNKLQAGERVKDGHHDRVVIGSIVNEGVVDVISDHA